MDENKVEVNEVEEIREEVDEVIEDIDDIEDVVLEDATTAKQDWKSAVAFAKSAVKKKVGEIKNGKAYKKAAKTVKRVFIIGTTMVIVYKIGKKYLVQKIEIPEVDAEDAPLLESNEETVEYPEVSGFLYDKELNEYIVNSPEEAINKINEITGSEEVEAAEVAVETETVTE